LTYVRDFPVTDCPNGAGRHRNNGWVSITLYERVLDLGKAHNGISVNVVMEGDWAHITGASPHNQ
jgi:hypothetical protein